MKSIEILAVGIRLIGIYVLLLALRTASNCYSTFVQSPSSLPEDLTIFMYFGFGEAIAFLLVSFVMLKFPVLISKWLLPKTKDGEVLLAGNAQDIQTSLFCVLGVYILSWAIPDFVDNAVLWWYSVNNEILQDDSSDIYVINEITTVLEIGIGLYLSLQASGLSNLLYRMRSAGAK